MVGLRFILLNSMGSAAILKVPRVGSIRRYFRLSPTVDHFLARRFIEPLLASLAAFVGIHVLINAVDRFNDVVLRGGTLGLQYLLLQIPIGMIQLLPPTCLTAVLLGFGLINTTGELLALQGLGISRFQLTAPVVVVAIFVSLFDFVVGETVVPPATQKANQLLNVRIRKQHIQGAFAEHGIWIRERNGFLSVDRFDAKKLKIEGVTLYHMDRNYGLQDIQFAKSADWNGHAWLPTGLKIMQIRAGDVKVAVTSGFHVEATPKDFRTLLQNPDEFSLVQLDHYIADLRRKGLSPGRYLVDRDLRYAKPFSCLIMTALGMVLSLDPVPRRSSLGKNFAKGIFVGFLYFLAQGFTVSFGRSELIPAWLAAWLPNLLFGVVALSIFLFGEEQ